MELGTTLAVGSSAEIVALGEDRVVKLYFPQHAAIAPTEHARAAAVHDAGLPCPAVYGLIEHDGRPGIVFERIDGPTLLDEVFAGQRDRSDAAELLARLHRDIHAAPLPAVPTWRDVVDPIRARLPPEGRARFDADTAPIEGELRCYHGDFHPMNVLLAERGPVVVDWQNVCLAPVMADVARSLVLLGWQDLHAGSDPRAVHLRAAYAVAYVEAYVAGSDLTIEEVVRAVPLHLHAIQRQQGPNPHTGPLERLVESGRWPPA